MLIIYVNIHKYNLHTLEFSSCEHTVITKSWQMHRVDVTANTVKMQCKEGMHFIICEPSKQYLYY